MPTLLKYILTNRIVTMRAVHPEEQHHHPVPRRASLMDIPMKKFAAEEFDEKAVVLCQFCGGASCKQEDYRTNKISPNAIQGLHSNWISPEILAMQRPSERLMKEYGLFEKFHKEKINSILNLQEPGEHPYCGDGIIPMVGFSYDPETFFTNGISFFNQSWEDMTATTFEHMMRIMNIFYISIVEMKGKISVHCHAGRGRTLLVICSWLIYYDRMKAKATIDLAVEKREGVLTRASQRQFLHDFQAQLKQRWTSFGEVLGRSFSQFVETQKVSLLKHEQKKCKFRPYVHTYIMEELRQRVQKDSKLGKQLIMCLISCDTLEKWSDKDEQLLQSLKNKINNHCLFFKEMDLVHTVPIKVLTELLFDFYDQLPFVLINIHAIEALLDHLKGLQAKIEAVLHPQFVHETGVQSIAVMLDFIQFFKSLVKEHLNLAKNDSEGSNLCDCLFLRLSLLLSSKRKFNHKIFLKNGRECKLLKYNTQKREKYTSAQDIKLTSYMRNITKQIEDEEQIQGLVRKIRKVDSNIHYFTKKQNNETGFLNHTDAKHVYHHSKA